MAIEYYTIIVKKPRDISFRKAFALAIDATLGKYRNVRNSRFTPKEFSKYKSPHHILCQAVKEKGNFHEEWENNVSSRKILRIDEEPDTV